MGGVERQTERKKGNSLRRYLGNYNRIDRMIDQAFSQGNAFLDGIPFSMYSHLFL